MDDLLHVLATSAARNGDVMRCMRSLWGLMPAALLLLAGHGRHSVRCWEFCERSPCV